MKAQLARAAAAGARFRFLGDDLEVDGLEHLLASDRAQLERMFPQIAEHLRDPALPADPEAILEQLDIQVELIEDMARAVAVVAELPAEVGLDLETMTRGPLKQTWLVLTKDGKRAVRQPKPDDAPLDPFRGQPRLVSVYDPARRTTFIFDVVKLGGYPPGLLERRVVGHNLLFDLAMLGAQGLAPASSIDTLQLAAMHLAPGKRSLAHVAEHFLGLTLPKDLAASNWAAPELNTAQIGYAGADPAVAHFAGKRMYAALEPRERTAFAVANRAVPAIVCMRLRGLPFDPAVHRQVIDGWQREFALRRAEFEQITGSPAPLSSNTVRVWLTERLSEDARQHWPRTPSGLLSTEKAAVKRMALDWPEVRPLLALRRVQTRIGTFGQSLIDLLSPTTGRLHGTYRLPAVTGRMSCSSPNLQNLPADARTAVRAAPGRLLLIADLNQIELRTAAELSGDRNMRAAFAAGEDLHDRFAAMLRPDFLQLPKETPERDLARKRAKAGHFGTLFAQTTPGFRAHAWKAFDLELSLPEAADIQAAFYRMYPAIRPYQEAQHRRGAWGVLYSIAGRPRWARWEKHGHMWLQLCANYSIQSSAADVLLEALHRVDQALPGALVAAVHDELVLEVDEAQAERATQVLEEQMVAAFQRWFPDAPALGLVDVAVRPCWAKPDMALPPVQPQLLAVRPVPVVAPLPRPAVPARRTPAVTASSPPDAGVQQFFNYLVARQRVHLRRQAGDPPPWTADPILRAHKFCCVDREDDRTTAWLRTHWRQPYADHPNLAFAMVMARLINNPVVLEALGYPEDWSAERALRRLQELEAGGTVIWTLSYRRCIPRSGSRLAYCVEILDRLHQDPPPLEQARTLEAAWHLLQDRPGVGPFVAYEVVSDLRHTPLLRHAPDIMTWAAAGPGAVRGLNRVWGRPVEQTLRPDQALAEMRLLLEISPQYLGAHVSAIEMRTIEHNLCELDKYERIRLGQGKGRPYHPPLKGATAMTTATPTPRRHLLPEVRERLELEILEGELLELEQAEAPHAARVPTLEELGEPAPHDPSLMGSSSLPHLIRSISNVAGVPV